MTARTTRMTAASVSRSLRFFALRCSSARARARSVRACRAARLAAAACLSCGFFFAIGVPFEVMGGAEEQRVQGQSCPRTHDQPEREREQAHVAGDLPGVLLRSVRDLAATAEAAAVDRQAPRPGRG